MTEAIRKACMAIIRIVSACTLTAGIVGCVSARVLNGDVTVVENVNVIVGDGTELRRNQSVVIAEDRIVAVENASSYRKPAGATVLDGSGKYLVPGFIDTHVHVALGPVKGRFENGFPVLSVEPSAELTTVTMEMLLEYGVTTARDPGGVAAMTVGARDRQAAGELQGPRLQVAGDLIDLSRFENLVATVENGEDVEAEIERQSEIGVDWIKLYTSLSPDLVEVAIAAAHQHDLKVTGHLDATTWTEAAEAGIDSLVHIIPGSERLLPAAARDAYARERMLSLFMLRWFELADYDSPEIRRMINALVENDVSLDPTLVLFHAMSQGDNDRYRRNPALSSMPEEMVMNWSTLFNFNIGWSQEEFEAARRAWPLVLEFTKLLHDQGVMLTAGTDANNPWVVPGDSFHTELSLLSSAGIAELDIMTIATLNGARLLGLEDEIGTVEAGKKADLVLLNANPLDRIENTRSIEWVMQSGTIIRSEP